MLRTFLSLTTLFVLILSSGCLMKPSDTIAPQDIWTNYELFYDEEEDKTYATAVFKVEDEKGNFISLTPPSSIIFNEDTLNWNPEWAAYHYEYSGFVQAGTFSFFANDEFNQNNFVNIEPIDFPESFGPILKYQSYPLAWEGIPVQDNEMVDVSVFNKITTQTQDNSSSEACPKGPIIKTYIYQLRNFVADQTGDTEVTIDGDKISRLNSGETFITIDRVSQRAFQDKLGRSGVVVGRYRTVEKSFQLN